MDKNKNFQFELFTQHQQNEGDRRSVPSGSVYDIIRRYEKRLVLIIVFMITAVIAYSVGMERGRQGRVDVQEVSPQVEPAVPIAAPQESARVSALLPEKPPETGITDNPEDPKERGLVLAAPSDGKKQEVSSQGRFYTIQLASYKTSSFAEREAERLKKKGYTPVLQKKGEYIILNVGKFASKEAAERIRKAQFEKKYEGCLVRRL